MSIATANEVHFRLGRGASDEEVCKEFAKHLMVKVDPDFPKKVQPNDYIIGGRGMGYGHDHYHAVQAMKGARMSAVLCEATNTNFKRNSIHVGFPLVEVKGIVAATKTGDELEVDLRAGVVSNVTSGIDLQFQPYPEFLIEMLQAGGLYPLLKLKRQPIGARA